ncbi:MAG: ABC transporter ATP-binding protein, partial [Synechococcaceae bacterium WB7_3xG_012]|nr:ABC transporter ATP-binding protein [Synechococcaceae bacterium WB7_3xG_012]
SFDPHTTDAISLIRQVSAAGLDISDISTAEPDLEDVFLRLTGTP